MTASAIEIERDDQGAVTSDTLTELLDANPYITTHGIVSPRAPHFTECREALETVTPDRIQKVLDLLVGHYPAVPLTERNSGDTRRVAHWLSVRRPFQTGVISEGELVLAALIEGYELSTSSPGRGALHRDIHIGIPRRLIDRDRHLTLRTMPRFKGILPKEKTS